MTGWVIVIALAVAAFVLAAFVLRLPRTGWTLFAAALVFGLAGYALQGWPDLPSAPRAATAQAGQDGEMLVAARREFFDSQVLPSRYVITADAFARRGQYEDAANFLRNAVSENPRDGEAWLALGNALVEHTGGQLTPAASYAFTRAAEVLPGNPAPGYFLGLAMLRSGQPDQTLALWNELLEKAPADAPWREGLMLRIERLEMLLSQMPPAPTGQTAR